MSRWMPGIKCCFQNNYNYRGMSRVTSTTRCHSVAPGKISSVNAVTSGHVFCCCQVGKVCQSTTTLFKCCFSGSWLSRRCVVGATRRVVRESLVHPVKGVPQLLVGNRSHAAQSLNKVLRCVKQFCYQLSKSDMPETPIKSVTLSPLNEFSGKSRPFWWVATLVDRWLGIHKICMSTENNKTCELLTIKYHVFSMEESERGREIDLIEFSIDTGGDAHPLDNLSNENLLHCTKQ